MMKDLNKFIGKYKVEKTLRFGLEPIGKTEAWMESKGVIANDKRRADNYAIVKNLIDRYHKVCIRESLTGCNLNWTQLSEAVETYRRRQDTESRKALLKCQDEYRTKIAKRFLFFKGYAYFTAPTPKTLIKNILPNCITDKTLPEFKDIEDAESAIQSLALFNGFAMYFEGYQKNRKNLYTAKNIASSAAHRIVHDNFSKFLTNIKVFENLRVIYPEILELCNNELRQYLKGKRLEEVFCLESFNNVLTQEGINLYNTLIGGVSGQEGERKCKGINELVNLSLQKEKQGRGKRTALTMVPLFKQILSDRNTYSYIPERINDEEELISAIRAFHAHIESFYLNGREVNVMEELLEIVENINSFDPNGIFIDAKKLNGVSKKLYDDIFELRARMTSHLEEQKLTKKNIENFFQKDAFSIKDMCLDKKHSLAKYFSGLRGAFKQ